MGSFLSVSKNRYKVNERGDFEENGKIVGSNSQLPPHCTNVGRSHRCEGSTPSLSLHHEANI